MTDHTSSFFGEGGYTAYPSQGKFNIIFNLLTVWIQSDGLEIRSPLAERILFKNINNDDYP